MACSHPERIINLSQQIAAGAAVLQEQSAAARRAVASVGSVWHGSSASAFEATGAHLAAQLARDSSLFSDIARALMELATTLEGAHELWHQADAAQNSAMSSALVGLPAASPQFEALAAQAREQVTLAVQRAVLAFNAVTADTWYFSGTALGGFVSDLEQELSGHSALRESGGSRSSFFQSDAASVEQAVRSLAKGRRRGVYVVPNPGRLMKLFRQLSAGGARVGGTYTGRMFRLPDGTLVGMRPDSASGGPTIDVKNPTGLKLKVHVQQ